MSRHLRFSDEYSAADSVAADRRLALEIDRARQSAPGLMAAVENHLEWVMDEARKGIQTDLTLNDPNFTLNTSLVDAEIDRAKAEHTRITKEINDKLKVVESEAEALMSTRGVAGVSKSRQKVIDDHAVQTAFITERARDLAFCDKARIEVAQAVKVRGPDRGQF